MRRKWIAAFGALLCALSIPFGRASGHRHRHDALKSFYIAMHGFSDDLAAWYQGILEVEPDGKNLRVTLIEISAASQACGGTLVRANQCLIRNRTIQKLVGRSNPCDFTAQGVQAALDAAKPKYMQPLEENSTVDIVATCGTQQRILSFPYTIDVDREVLHRDNPRVDELWNLRYSVKDRAFGKGFWFDYKPAQEKKFEDLGTALLPELRSGKYDAGFDDPCSGPKCGPSFLVSLLKGYTGPPANPDPSYVELENASSLHLAKYVPPQFPAIAKTAHIFGKVRLSIVADSQTGAVTDVKLLSGNPLLGRRAIAAASHWQFFPRPGLGDKSIDVSLNFHLCGE